MNNQIMIAFNQQINEELYSFYLYLAAAAEADFQKLPGLANWLQVQAKEEYDHALGFYNYLVKQNMKVEFLAIAKPTLAKTDPLSLLQQSLAHEQHITGCIQQLVALADQEQNIQAKDFLQWYVEEQQEEEESFAALLFKVEELGGPEHAFEKLEVELGQRTYHPSSILSR